MADYELMFIVDPRLSDEETVAVSDEYKELLTSLGATVTKEESWGKRRLAYEINKLNEGHYVLFHVDVTGDNPFVEVERRLHQNEKVLRYLTVRMDAGRMRRRAPMVPAAPAAEAKPAAAE
jgi:small subunit ribosomal protein S6